MQCEVPALKDVAQNLTALLGRNVGITKSAAPFKPPASEPVLVAVFRALDGSAAAICLADLKFAAHSAAALAMLPAPRAEECLRAKKLDEQLAENFHEVMNVISTIISTEHNRIRLDAVVAGLAAIPADAAPLVGKSRARLDLDADITGYAKGRLAFLAA